jgi:Holliday junction resolvase
MNTESSFWNELSTYETLRRRRAEFLSEINFRIEKTGSCLQKCQERIAELDDYAKRAKIPYFEQERAELHDSVLYALERARDFTNYWKKNLAGDLAELNLMEKLLNAGIDSRYSGKTTAVDIFAKVKDKIVLIQVKATNASSRAISEEEIKDLLTDSIFLEKYPLVDIAFSDNTSFEHFFVPIEEIMANLKRRTISLSRSRLEKIVNIDFSNFEKRMKECSFPIMKFDKTQFESWIDKL